MMSIGGIDSGVKISVLRELVLSPFCCCPFNGVLYPLTLLCLGPSKPQSGLKSKRLTFSAGDPVDSQVNQKYNATPNFDKPYTVSAARSVLHPSHISSSSSDTHHKRA